jgi:hypothetical protein
VLCLTGTFASFNIHNIQYVVFRSRLLFPETLGFAFIENEGDDEKIPEDTRVVKNEKINTIQIRNHFLFNHLYFGLYFRGGKGNC